MHFYCRRRRNGKYNKGYGGQCIFLGIAKTYKLGVAVMETRWEMVKPDIKAKIDRKTTALARKISGKSGKIKPGIKTKGFFTIMSAMQKNGFNPADVEYWKEKNWTSGNRPWKN